MNKNPGDPGLFIIRIYIGGSAAIADAVEDADRIIEQAAPAEAARLRLLARPDFPMPLDAQVTSRHQIGDHRAFDEESVALGLRFLQSDRDLELAKAELQARV